MTDAAYAQILADSEAAGVGITHIRWLPGYIAVYMDGHIEPAQASKVREFVRDRAPGDDRAVLVMSGD